MWTCPIDVSTSVQGCGTRLAVAIKERMGLDLCLDRTAILQDLNYIPSYWALAEMMIPPRTRGAAILSNTRYTLGYHPHPRDRTVRRHPQQLVIPEHSYGSMYPLQRFCQETGELEDIFYVDNGSRDTNRLFIGRSPVYLKREFPVECTACQVTLHNSRAVLEHCVASYEHIYKSTPPESRVPVEFIDPRHHVDYAHWNAFTKARALTEYHTKVVTALRAVPMDAAGRRNMQRLTDAVYGSVVDLDNDEGYFLNENDRDGALEQCHFDKVVQVCLEGFAVSEFEQNGLQGYPLDLLLHGWSRFEMYGSSSFRGLMCGVAGVDV